MNKNIGNADRAIRLIVGVGIIVAGVMNNSLLGAIGLIPILTALISWCPLYPIFKINTRCENNSCDK
jgi:hypothetical protein